MTPRLTVALVVRDEARMLGGFLEAARGLWDELLAVDTGSTDDTRALLLASGARVVDSPWRRDFAHARNVSLAHATGDWVLVLDADERVCPEFIEALRAAMLRPGLGALEVCLSSQLPYGHRRDAWQLRAWRNDPSIHFEHPVREDASQSVRALLSSRGWSLERLEPPVLHLGYVRDRDAAKRKLDRDVSILRERLAVDPGALWCWRALLALARQWQDERLWRDAAREATDVIESLGRELVDALPWGSELVALIAEGLFAPESSAGLAFLEGWAERLAPGPAFLLRRGFFRESQGLHEEARADYLACLEAPLEREPQLVTVAPRLGLARLELARDDAPAALLHCRLALDAGPRDPEALMAVASLTRRLEGKAAFEAWCAAREAEEPSCPERDWAVGEALLASGEPRAAAAAFRRAAGVPPGGPAALRLAQALLAAGLSEASEQLANQLLPQQPEAGLGVLLFDLAAGRNTDLELELTPETANAALRQWVDAMLMSRQRVLVRRVQARVKAVDALFPWLTGYLRRKSA